VASLEKDLAELAKENKIDAWKMKDLAELAKQELENLLVCK
jgi:hypothetical protein